MHKTMASVVSLEKIEIIRSQEFMLSEVRLKFLKKIIILGPKTTILGPQFCRILVLGPHFWWSGGPGPRGPPGSAPVKNSSTNCHLPKESIEKKSFYIVKIEFAENGILLVFFFYEFVVTSQMFCTV